MIAAHLEIRELVERSASWRQQHHGLAARCLRIARGLGNGFVQSAGDFLRHAFESFGKFLRRLADQIGLADTWKEFAQGFDATALWLAARNPVNVVKRRQRTGSRIGIGALGIVDEQYIALSPDLLHAMRQPRKAAQASLHDVERYAQRECCTRGTSRILRVVTPAQRADAMQIDQLRGAAGRAAHDGLAIEKYAVLQPALHRDGADMLACKLRAARRLGAKIVIDADNRGAATLHADDEALLHFGIILDAAVAIDVIFRDVEQYADARIERWREIDLVGRHLNDMDPPRRGRLQRQARGADIAAHLHIVSCIA